MHRILAFSIGCLLAASPACAANKEPERPAFLIERDKPTASGRAVLVEVPQPEVGIEVEVGRVISDSVYGGGILGAIILSSSDRKRESLTKLEEEKAQAQVATLRKTLTDFDFQGAALASTKTALSRLDWFSAREAKQTKISSEGERLAFVQAEEAEQLATLTYRYSLSPDFTQIRVIAEVALWRHKLPRSKQAPNVLMPIYFQRIMSIIELRTRSYDHAENVAAWSARDGQIAEAALAAAMGRLEQLIPFALELKQADIARFQNPKADKLFAAGFYGPPVQFVTNAPGETVIWVKGLISVMPAPELPKEDIAAAPAQPLKTMATPVSASAVR